MSKSKHTTGRLQVMAGDRQPRICINGDKDWPIVVVISGHSPEGIRANEQRIVSCWNAMDGIDDPAAARVIIDESRTAAATDMLTALKAAFIALGRNGANMKSGMYREEWEMCRAAIAQAEGKK
jgi:hypothetical protein